MNESRYSGFVLAESVGRSSFDDDVYAHLGTLAAVEFSRADSPAQAGTFKFDAVKYQALEQAAFEESPRIEGMPAQPVNWSDIDDRVTIFENMISDSLRSVQKAADPSGFVQFSAKCYENWLAYKGMFPTSNGSNPWSRAVSVLKRGHLLVIDDEDRLERMRRRPPSESGASNLGVLVQGASQRPVLMPVDNRFALQAKLLALLKENARGHANRLSLKVIAEMLASSGTKKMTDAAIQISLTTPLKKAGVIGSTSKGFFFIDSEADLIESYCFHRTKILSVDKIMHRYEARARDMNPDLDLENECSGGRAVNNRLP